MVEVARRKQREVKPRTYSSENKRPTISFRVRADMFDKLKTSAKEHDLSLSEEVERCVNFKFNFARDTHDELVMKSIRNAFAMAEKVAGCRWFESKDSAKLCNAAIVSAAHLLMLGIGPGDQKDLNVAADDAGAAIGGKAVSENIGWATDESKQRYEQAIAGYKDQDRLRYLLVKGILGELPDITDPPSPSIELALRLSTPAELAAVQATVKDAEEPVSAPVHKPRTIKRKIVS